MYPDRNWALLLGLLFVVSCAQIPKEIYDPIATSDKSESSEVEPPPPDQSAEDTQEKEYSAFYDEGDHLKELTLAGKYNQAIALYEGKREEFFEKKGFFSQITRKEKYKEQLKIISTNFNEEYSKKIKEAIDRFEKYSTWPSKEEDWTSISEDIKFSETTSAEYDSYFLLRDPTFRSKEIDTLHEKINNFKNVVLTNADSSFVKYDIFSNQIFFDYYPIKIQDQKDFISKTFSLIRERLSSATTFQLERFFTNYSLNDEEKEWVSNQYIDLSLKNNLETNKSIQLKDIIQAVNTAREKGFSPNKIKQSKVSFVDATSQTLLKEGRVAFPPKIDIDLPFETKKTDLENALSETSDSEHIIIFDVAQSSIKRRILKREKIRSNKLVGYKDVPNPEYNQATLGVQGAQMQFATAGKQPCIGPSPLANLGCQFGNLGAISAAKSNLAKAQQWLSNTPQYLQEEVIQQYDFNVSDLTATKVLSANYYVIDRKNNKYFKSNFDISDSRSFLIAYNIDDKDKELDSHLSTYDKEDAVSTFEDAPLSVKLSDLLSNYIENIDKSKTIEGEDALRAEILTDKNLTLAKVKETTYDQRPLNDPRFDNVVVVFNPKGGLGTGFYVRPNLVLTNYHVIEGAKFIEIKLHNGLESFGKVVKSDVRLDLALIKVESQGTPVKFYDSTNLPVGATVDAIGHPSGLEYTITKGIISALRKRESSYDVGGQEVLFVQTDAAINPGNSGGPLFLEEKVIGVNNNKIVSNTVEGLGFAIHFSEVNLFLDEEF